MIRTAVTIWRIAMARQDSFHPQFSGTGHGGFKIVNFKPQEHSISGFDLRVANGTVMMLNVSTVQLKNQPTI